MGKKESEKDLDDIKIIEKREIKQENRERKIINKRENTCL